MITGGASGIGAETAARLAADGFRVAIIYRSGKDAAQSRAKAIRANGGAAEIFQADLTSEADVARAVADIVAHFGGIDVLVNSAGISTMSPLGEMTPDMIDRELSTNVKSVVLVTQACLPHMPEGGAIVNVGSNLADAPIAGLSLYSATKAAVASLTKGFARELGRRSIRVNAVAPGATRTPMTAWIDDESMASIAEATPLGRIAEPEDIAGAIAFLAGPSAGWINGRTIVADGGLV